MCNEGSIRNWIFVLRAFSPQKPKYHNHFFFMKTRNTFFMVLSKNYFNKLFLQNRL